MAKVKKPKQRAGGSSNPTGNIRPENRIDENASYIIMPDVSDIPGQEKIVEPGIPEEMADTTVSSDDEEGIRNGKDLLDDDDSDVNIVMGTEADVTKEDIALLGRRDQDMDMGDDELVLKEGLDDRDFEGELLNEAPVNDDSTGDDLDIPQGESKLSKEDGEEDEENDYYSLGGDKE